LFKTTQFLEENFATPDAVVGLSSCFNVEVPTRDTVRKWFSRGAIPGEWWPILLLILECQNGAPISLLGYMGKETVSNDIFE
jgi:hypothetical protein